MAIPRLKVFLLLLLLTAFSLPVEARSAPLFELLDQPVPSYRSADKLAAIETAWVRALAELQWTVETRAPGRIEAKRLVRSKHVVEVEIAFDEHAYSVHYRRSTNMNFKVDSRRGRLIHPNYMKWVEQLRQSFITHLVAG